MYRHGHSQRRRAFTLVEVLMATVLIGLAFTSLLVSLSAGTSVNQAGHTLTTATFLAQEVRERTLRLPFVDPDLADRGKPPGPDGTDPQVFVDDIDDIKNITFSPPRDARGTAITNLTAWSQKIHMTWRDRSNLETIVPEGDSDIINVEVTILYGGKPQLVTNYLATRRGEP